MRTTKNYLPYAELQKMVLEKGIKSQKEYHKWRQECNIEGVPAYPDDMYKNNGWNGWEDFLGKKRTMGVEWTPYHELQKMVLDLGVKTAKEYQKWQRTCGIKGVPSSPDKIYKDNGWEGFDTFFSKKRSYNVEWLSYTELQMLVLEKDIKNREEYNEWQRNCNIKGVPSSPDKIYKDNGWEGFESFFGKKRTMGVKWMSYEELQKLVLDLGIKTKKEYEEWQRNCNIKGVPFQPNRTYKNNGWQGFESFLGKKRTMGVKWMSYEELQKLVSQRGIKSQKEYQEWQRDCNIEGVPADPRQLWKNNGWQGFESFFKKKRIFGVEWMSYEELQKLVLQKDIKSAKQYKEWQRNCDIEGVPSHPDQIYKDNGWTSWADFLQTENHITQKIEVLEYLYKLRDSAISLETSILILLLKKDNNGYSLTKKPEYQKLKNSEAGEERKNAINELIAAVEGSEQEEYEAGDGEWDGDDESESDQPDTTHATQDEPTIQDEPQFNLNEDGLRIHNPLKELNDIGNLIGYRIDDQDTVEFLQKNQLKKLWANAINNPDQIKDLINFNGDENANHIRDMFIDEYNEVIKITNAKDYIFPHPINLMQKLITHRLTKERRYGNWSGTGTGKTLSAIFAGRYANKKRTLIVCNNSTVDNWIKSIHAYFKNSTIYTKTDVANCNSKEYTAIDKWEQLIMNGEDFEYLILNYETFQQINSENLCAIFVQNNTLDYIIMDEVQYAKQRDSNQSIRRKLLEQMVNQCAQKNEDMLFLPMTATPVVNNLTEAKKLIELVTGVEQEDLQTKSTQENAARIYVEFTLKGLRYNPKRNAELNVEFFPIDGLPILEDLQKIYSDKNHTTLDIEQILVPLKFQAIKHKLKRGVILYTTYVSQIVDTLKELVISEGFSCGVYTGENKDGLQQFKDGKVDILIGSTPISTGVDGLQKICDTIIPISLMWTSSEYHQLIGRIERQGCAYDKVHIYIPQVVIGDDDNKWSFDEYRYNIIQYKSKLAEASVDGRLNLKTDEMQAMEEAKTQLADWIKKIETDGLVLLQKNNLQLPLLKTQQVAAFIRYGDFSKLNQKWSVSNSSTTHQTIQNNPSEWFYYHTLYKQHREEWNEIPYEVIREEIRNRPDWIVADFGCGENLLPIGLTNKFHSFDHYAINESVIACDMKNTPLDNNAVDCAVFSLSLMGANYSDYLKEAHRILKPMGFIFVAEPAKKHDNNPDNLSEILKSNGFQPLKCYISHSKFIYATAIKV